MSINSQERSDALTGDMNVVGASPYSVSQPQLHRQWSYHQKNMRTFGYQRPGAHFYNMQVGNRSQGWSKSVQYPSNGPMKTKDSGIKATQQSSPAPESPVMKSKTFSIPPSPPRRKPKRSRWSTRLKPLTLSNPDQLKSPVNKPRSLPSADLSLGLGVEKMQIQKPVEVHVKTENEVEIQEHISKKEPTRITPKKEPIHITPKKEPTRITKAKKPEKPKKSEKKGSTTTANGITWPETLINYVEQTLSKCPEKLRTATEVQLKKKIETAMKNNTLNTIKWENEPLVFMNVRQEQEARKPMVVQKTRGRTPVQNRKKLQNNQNEWNSQNNKWGKQGQNDGQFGDDDYDPFQKTTFHKKGNKNKKFKKKKNQMEFDTFVDAQENSKRKDRAQRFEKTLVNNISDELSLKNKKYDHYGKMQKRAYGASTPSKIKTRGGGMWAGAAIVGTSQSLEKQYLRLTSAPDPSTVRPESVLRRTFDMLKRKWKSIPNYKYTCEQYKSMRQDLTVQHIKNNFTVDVYETHARTALAVGDLSEFNQCQTQLMQLYDLQQRFRKNFFEFTLYRMLYYLITDNSASLHSMLKDLHTSTRSEKSVSYGLTIRECVVSNNYYHFFKIYKDAPHNATLLTTKILPIMRFRALERITRAYRPGKIDVNDMQRILNMDNLSDCKEYVLDRGGKFDRTGKFFLTKESVIHRPTPEDEANKNKEEDDKLGITHGAFIYT